MTSRLLETCPYYFLHEPVFHIAKQPVFIEYECVYSKFEDFSCVAECFVCYLCWQKLENKSDLKLEVICSLFCPTANFD